MVKRRPIPHTITLGANRPVIFVEMWPGESKTAEPGTGYVRTFGATDWVRAACYIDELRRGHVSGRY
jgi:hypothetical protein